MTQIMMIDDDRTFQAIHQLLLTRAGYDFIGFDSGLEALDWLETGQVDLIIVDLLLPDMDGLEICNRIRSRERLKTLPLLLYTARYNPETRLLVKLVEAELLPKPSAPNDFLAKIRAMLEGTPAPESAPPKPPPASSQTTQALIARLEDPVGCGSAIVQLSIRRREDDTLFRETPAQDAFWRNVYHSLGSLSDEQAAAKWSQSAEVALALSKPADEQNQRLLAVVETADVTANREIAIRALGLNRYAAAAPLLMAACHEEAANLRTAALEALSMIGQGAELVEQALQDSVMSVRYTAVNALATLGAQAALQRALQNPDRMMRIDVVKALLRDECQVERAMAAEMVLQALAIETDTDVIYSMCKALGQMEYGAARPVLEGFADHPNAHVQDGARKALRMLSG